MSKKVTAFVDCPTVTEYIEGLGEVQMKLSYEALQDLHAYQALFASDRTGPISDEEIKGWQEMDEMLEKFDRQEVIKKYSVEIFRDWDFVPYEEYEW